MEIEKADISDAEEILLLQKLAYKSEAEIYNNYDIPPIIQTLFQIQKDFEKWTFLKAMINGKIIGSVRAYDEDGICHIGRLIVHPNFQNQGIGTELLNKIENTFRCKIFELFTGNKSLKNLYLYKKLGYMEFKTERIDNVDFIFLRKQI